MLPQAKVRSDGGIVQHQVRRAGAVQNRGAEGCDIVFERYISDLEEMWRRALLPEIGNPRLIAATAGDLPTDLDEERDHGATKAAGTTGDDDGFRFHGVE